MKWFEAKTTLNHDPSNQCSIKVWDIYTKQQRHMVTRPDNQQSWNWDFLNSMHTRYHSLTWMITVTDPAAHVIWQEPCIRLTSEVCWKRVGKKKSWKITSFLTLSFVFEQQSGKKQWTPPSWAFISHQASPANCTEWCVFITTSYTVVIFWTMYMYKQSYRLDKWGKELRRWNSNSEGMLFPPT